MEIFVSFSCYVFFCLTPLARTCMPASAACAPRAGYCCRVSLVSVDAAALPPLPTGGRGTRHLGDIDRGLPVCCDTDPGAEESFTVPEGDTEFLGVVLVWAHIIDDACGPDAFDEHVVSWDDGSGGYSHHGCCFYLLLIYLVAGRGFVGCVFDDGTVCYWAQHPVLSHARQPPECGARAAEWCGHHMTTLLLAISLISSSS